MIEYLKKVYEKFFPCKHKIYSSIDCFRYILRTDAGYNTIFIYKCDKCGTHMFSDRWAFSRGSGSQEDYCRGSRTKKDTPYIYFQHNKDWCVIVKDLYSKYFPVTEDENTFTVEGIRII